MKYIVDNDITYEGFPVRLKNLVSKRKKEELGEDVTATEELVEYVNAFGESIGIIAIED